MSNADALVGVKVKKEVEDMANEVVRLQSREDSKDVPRTSVAECVKTFDLTSNQEEEDGTESGRASRYALKAAARNKGFSNSAQQEVWVMTEFRDHSPFCYADTVIGRTK